MEQNNNVYWVSPKAKQTHYEGYGGQNGLDFRRANSPHAYNEESELQLECVGKAQFATSNFPIFHPLNYYRLQTAITMYALQNSKRVPWMQIDGADKTADVTIFLNLKTPHLVKDETKRAMQSGFIIPCVPHLARILLEHNVLTALTKSGVIKKARYASTIHLYERYSYRDSVHVTVKAIVQQRDKRIF